MALKDMPEVFDVDSEEDIRLAVVKYFLELGFELDEMRTETKFTIHLGRNELPAGGGKISQRDRVTGRSDLLLTRNRKPLAIVETKALGHTLNEKDAQQALSYARLLLDMAPFAIVTNGKETRVYDTFASTLTPIEAPTDSLWSKQGQQPPLTGDDFHFEAARKLISVNPRTLQLFCQKQITQAMEDIKGGPFDAKMYVPNVYVPRYVIKQGFNDWLQSDMPCFAVVAESGFGKTNFMCATAEELAADSFVLFYSAIRLVESLRKAICEDFEWEFHRENDLANIADRFTAIARELNRAFYIFVDGLDEFPGNQLQFKNELLYLVSRLRGSPIRLCLSCKSSDWDGFVIENSRSYNRLANSVYPPRSREDDISLKAIHQPTSRSVGVWLEQYTDEELDATFLQYKAVFSLQGTLREMTRDECRFPLILRLVAEVWSGRASELPTAISQREVYDEYWKMQMGKVHQQIVAERWLTTLAKLTVESGERYITRQKLLERLDPTDAQDAPYQELLRYGLLRVTHDSQGSQMISFGFQQLRSYVYTLKTQAAWLDQPPQEVAKMICSLLDHPVGFETVEFYLRVIDRGETHLLTDVGLLNIHSFVRLMESINLKSSVWTSSSPDERSSAFMSHLKQYIVAYSELSRFYFPEQCEKLVPYTTGEVGLWVSGSMHQFRTRTPSYPQPVIVLPHEVALALWNRTAPSEVYSDLQPGGTINLDLGMSSLVDQLPQKMAWQRILSQITRLFATRCLDETHAPELLQERVWHILQQQPFGLKGVPATGPYWQVLGLQKIEDIQTTSTDELFERTRTQIREKKQQFVQLIQQRSADLQENSEPDWVRWYRLHFLKLQRLYYALDSLRLQQPYLLLPFPVREAFDYLHTGDLAPTVSILEKLVTSIVSAYSSLVSQNFSRLAEQLAFFRFSDASMLVELTHEPTPPGVRNDVLRIAYVLLPTVQLTTKYLVYTCNEDDARQVISFARLVPGMTPFAIVTNGTDTHIYDTVTSILIESTMALRAREEDENGID